MHPCTSVRRRRTLAPPFLGRSSPGSVQQDCWVGVSHSDMVHAFKSFHRMNTAAINIALAFNMGKDMESIVSNPIGQPMATVRFCCLSAWRCSSADALDLRISDTVQQPRPQRDARHMDRRGLYTVGILIHDAEVRMLIANTARFLMGSSTVRAIILRLRQQVC